MRQVPKKIQNKRHGKQKSVRKENLHTKKTRLGTHRVSTQSQPNQKRLNKPKGGIGG